MLAKEFIEGFPGRLIPTGETGVVAFVPAPLPRALPLDLTTIRLLADAENALGRLQGAVGRMVSPHLVGRPLLNREAILSSRIEGTFTTPQQLALLEAVEAEHPSRRVADADAREVHNYVRAMEFGLKRLTEFPVCLRLIKEIHGVLMENVRGDSVQAGEFRGVQNYIGREADGLRGARFVPPPVKEMHACLDDLERYINAAPQTEGEDELPLLVRLALIHYQFETIHPFLDGNGRVGRLLIPLVLASAQRTRGATLYLSSHLERHRQEYVDLMLGVSQRADWGNWLHFFLRAVSRSAQESLRRVDRVLELRTAYHGRFHSARSSALLLKLIDRLFVQPAITIPAAAALLGVTPASASANIKKLVQAGILSEATGRKRDQVFVASELVSVAHDEAPESEGS